MGTRIGPFACHRAGDHIPHIRSSQPSSRALRPGKLIAAGLAALIAMLMHTGAVRAGDVQGEIKFEPKNLGAPPVRNQGFIERIENPLRPIRRFDPRPHMVVVLEDGPMAEDATTAPAAPVPYRLVGESFAADILPVVANTRVELQNRSPRTVVLLAPEDPELLDSVTLKPKGFHEIKIAKPDQSVLIRSQDSVHLGGRIVAFSHRYFATVDARGRFEIKDVPEGTWKARLWYRDGWLKDVEASVEVGRKSATFTLSVSSTQVRQDPEK